MALGVGVGLGRSAGGLTSGGDAPPAGAYDGLVATHIRIPDFQQSSTFINAMCRTGCKASEDLTRIKVAWANWRVFTGDPGGSGGTLTMNAAAIEYPIGSTRQAMTFNGGDASSSATPNGETVFSDYLTLAETIPAGEIFRIWFYQTMGGVGILKRNSGADTTTFGDVASLGTAGSPAADRVLSGAAPSSNIGTGYVPVVAVISETTNKSVIIVGDSIGAGLAQTGGPDRPDDTYGHIGIIAHDFPNDLPFLNLSSSGALAQTFLTASTGGVGRAQLLPYCSHMVDETGINDIRNGVSAATVVGYKQTIAAAFPERVKKYVTTLGPTNATSTDGFTTVENQTADSLRGPGMVAFNALVRAGLDGYDGYFDIGDVVSSSRDSGKWVVPIVTTPRTVTDGAVSASSTAFTSATANFTAADLYTGITVAGAGISGAALKVWVAAVNSATSVTLSTAASTTVSGATTNIGANSVDGLHPTAAGYALPGTAGIIVFD